MKRFLSARVFQEKLYILLVVFLVSFAVFMSNSLADYKRDLSNTRTRRILTSDDLVSNTFLPYSLIKHKTLKMTPIMDDIRPLFQGGREVPYFTIYNENQGEFYSSYPVFTGLVALPFYLLPVLLKVPNLDTHLNLLKVMAIGRASASIIASFSVAAMYLILKKFAGDKKYNLLIYIFTAFYAFGTTTWSVSSRGLWQHTVSQLLLSLLILNLWYSLKNDSLIKYSGLILGMAVITRPTNLIFALLFSIYVLIYYKKHFVKFIWWATPPALFLFAYNWSAFGSPFVEGYQSRKDVNINSPLRVGLMGYLFSPGRSFLFLSPPLVLGLVEMVKTLFAKKIGKKPSVRALKWFLALGFVTFTLVMAKWWAWDGANSFGYRMLTDVLPIITLFSFFIIKNLKRPLMVVVLLLMVYSFYVHFNATIYRKSRCSHESNWNFYCLKLPSKKAKY